MTNKDVDLIEIGRGYQSKVISTNNSIGEYGATVMSILMFVGQGTVYVWLALWLLLYVLNFQFLWAMGLSLIISIALTILCVCTIIKIIKVLHKMNQPEQVRDERGRYARETPVHVMGKRAGTIKTMENGQSEYVSQWGGGVDK